MRTNPYTEIGIKRVPCFRCGKPSKYQWQICALGNKWAGLCVNCDIDLNGLVVRFMRIPNSFTIMQRYIKKAGRKQ